MLFHSGPSLSIRRDGSVLLETTLHRQMELLTVAVDGESKEHVVGSIEIDDQVLSHVLLLENSSSIFRFILTSDHF